MRLSTRPVAVVALLGLLLCAAAPAEAARSSSKRKSSKRAEKRTTAPAKKKVSTAAAAPQTKRAATRTRRSSRDTSLRGRFASIPAPKVKGASKLRLEWRASGAGDGRSGKLFRAGKLKAKGPTGSSFAQKVRANTRKALRKQ